jgi:hypothetical protein
MVKALYLGGAGRICPGSRNVGIPLSIGTQIIAAGAVAAAGVLAPGEAFDPETVCAQLARRDFHIHHEAVDVGTEPTPASADQYR